MKTLNLWIKTLLPSDIYSAVGEGFFCFLSVTQQKKLMMAQTIKTMIWTANPVAIAFSLESPTMRNPAAHPASSVPQFPIPLIGKALATTPTVEPKTILAKGSSIPNPFI